jgi:hypothetical protein
MFLPLVVGLSFTDLLCFAQYSYSLHLIWSPLPKFWHQQQQKIITIIIRSTPKCDSFLLASWLHAPYAKTKLRGEGDAESRPVGREEFICFFIFAR